MNDDPVKKSITTRLAALREHLEGTQASASNMNQLLGIMVDGLLQRDNQGNQILPLKQFVRINLLMYGLERDEVRQIAAAADPENRVRLTKLAQRLIEYERIDASVAHAALVHQIAKGKFPEADASAARPPMERIHPAPAPGNDPSRPS